MGQPEFRPTPFEEGEPKLLLQGLELKAHRRLAKQQVGRGGRDASPLGNGVEDPKMMKVHIVADPPERPYSRWRGDPRQINNIPDINK